MYADARKAAPILIAPQKKEGALRLRTDLYRRCSAQKHAPRWEDIKTVIDIIF